MNNTSADISSSAPIIGVRRRRSPSARSETLANRGPRSGMCTTAGSGAAENGSGLTMTVRGAAEGEGSGVGVDGCGCAEVTGLLPLASTAWLGPVWIHALSGDAIVPAYSHAYGHVYRHAYGHVYRHACGHAYGHVYRHGYEHVYRQAYEHVYRHA